MELEMENITDVKKQMQLHISEQRDKLKACNLELKKKEKKICEINRTVKNILTDIHHVVSEHYQNPAKLGNAVKVRKYVKH